MTYRDAIIQVLSEVSGQPKERFIKVLDLHKHELDFKGHKLDKELTDEEAQQLLDGFRKEGSGILASLVRGSIEIFKAKNGKP